MTTNSTRLRLRAAYKTPMHMWELMKSKVQRIIVKVHLHWFSQMEFQQTTSDRERLETVTFYPLWVSLHILALSWSRRYSIQNRENLDKKVSTPLCSTMERFLISSQLMTSSLLISDQDGMLSAVFSTNLKLMSAKFGLYWSKKRMQSSMAVTLI